MMKKTILFENHKKRQARFISFAGWHMPFSYSNSHKEHLQVRKTGGLFDVSHMGQIRIKGKESLSFLEKLLPTQLKSLKKGQALYSVLCLPTGGLIDDLILYVFSEENYLLCVNSAFKDKDLKWLKSQHTTENLQIQDESKSWGIIALQGPLSFELSQRVFPSLNFQKIQRFHFVECESLIISRTGYTGEEGFEFYIPCDKLLSFWEKFTKKGKDLFISPVGLGARDTLRLEKAYLLSGQDFNETKTPLQAGLSWLLTNPENYIGKSSLLKQKEQGRYECLKALIMEENSAVPRYGYPLYSSSGSRIGHITSGAKSPSLDKIIALAYLKEEEKTCWMRVRDSQFQALTVKKPFFNKTGKT
ncbi:MAG: glycine cleavage system aminomethyltransferase GcvT [Bdellovibrionales bacterium]|nr:glycine cleavage system aminomethyltransferase GcvT [Bdellovibrionales bacterium]